MSDIKRKMMVDTQIKSRGVTNEKVLDAMRKVERHVFVPEGFKDSSYSDTPLPIGYGQTISQPYIVAYMTEALALVPEDRVLEIGTGCGYQAAILAEIVKEVYTMEVVKSLAVSARERLKNLGYDNIKVKWSDGHEGWPECAPYDAVIVTASPEEIPEKLINQLTPGGRMIIPVGSFSQELILITKKESGYDKRSLLSVRFVPMVHSKKEE